MSKIDAAQELSQHIQLAIEILKEAQGSLNESNAIRGGIYGAAANALIGTVLDKINILAPLQMHFMPDGEGKKAVQSAIDEVNNKLDVFQKLFKEEYDGDRKS